MDLRSHIRNLIKEGITSSFPLQQNVIPITSKRAAEIASLWHGGMNTAFYSLASTGKFFPQLYSDYMRELRSAPVDPNSSEDMLHLEQLENWLKQQASKYTEDQLDTELNEPQRHVNDAALEAYLNAAIMLCGDGGVEKTHGVDDFTPEAIQDAKISLATFKQRAGDLLNGIPDDSIGEDLWLTRNGHGSGFWDRGYDKATGKALSDIAHSMGERNCEVQDDGQLTFMEI